MDIKLRLIISRLQGNAADANAIDALDTGILDQPGHQIECLGNMIPRIDGDIGNGENRAAPVGDFCRQTVEPLAGAQISVKTAACVESGRHSVETGGLRPILWFRQSRRLRRHLTHRIFYSRPR